MNQYRAARQRHEPDEEARWEEEEKQHGWLQEKDDLCRLHDQEGFSSEKLFTAKKNCQGDMKIKFFSYLLSVVYDFKF